MDHVRCKFTQLFLVMFLVLLPVSVFPWTPLSSYFSFIGGVERGDTFWPFFFLCLQQFSSYFFFVIYLLKSFRTDSRLGYTLPFMRFKNLKDGFSSPLRNLQWPFRSYLFPKFIWLILFISLVHKCRSPSGMSIRWGWQVRRRNCPWIREKLRRAGHLVTTGKK